MVQLSTYPKVRILCFLSGDNYIKEVGVRGKLDGGQKHVSQVWLFASLSASHNLQMQFI